MFQKEAQSLRWDIYAKVIILVFALLQILRWRLLPQFMDIYYHLLTAWGFLKAGGFSGWDFWQYAPVGRPHIYPPLFHLLLALLVELGIDKIVLAKFFETAGPVLFLIVLWRFVKRHYGSRLSLFVLLILSSSFSFYVSLGNHLPATLGMVLGFFAFERILQRQFFPSALFLALCFYTHIGAAAFFAAGVLFYGLLCHPERKICFLSFSGALILASPILFKQLVALRLISISGIAARYACEFKTLEYILAFFGMLAAWKKKRCPIFLSLFFASFIFLAYPYRFFSAQGYLPVILLGGLGLDETYAALADKPWLKRMFFMLTAFFLLFSPTLLTEKSADKGRWEAKLYLYDSALVDMLFPGCNIRLTSSTMWHDREYRQTAELIRQNSQEDEIIYSTVFNVGVCLASIAGRATANSLFPEIGPAKKFNPLQAAKVVIMLADDDAEWVNSLVSNYHLVKIGQNRLFLCYKNPSSRAKIIFRKATLPFTLITLFGLTYLALFFSAAKSIANPSLREPPFP